MKKRLKKKEKKIQEWNSNQLQKSEDIDNKTKPLNIYEDDDL